MRLLLMSGTSLCHLRVGHRTLWGLRGLYVPVPLEDVSCDDLTQTLGTGPDGAIPVRHRSE